SLYYAHLDSQVARPGQAVEPGDVLGLMGNTGNARGTPTHLHFGIYGGGGALNPYYFVAGGSGLPPRIAGSPDEGDSLWRTSARATLQATPEKSAGPPLPAATAIRLLAASGNHYRVELPDGRMGWIRTGNVQPAARPLRTLRQKTGTPLLHRPDEGEAII